MRRIEYISGVTTYNPNGYSNPITFKYAPKILAHYDSETDFISLIFLDKLEGRVFKTYGDAWNFLLELGYIVVGKSPSYVEWSSEGWISSKKK
jgi:hypothetical protein